MQFKGLSNDTINANRDKVGEPEGLTLKELYNIVYPRVVSEYITVRDNTYLKTTPTLDEVVEIANELKKGIKYPKVDVDDEYNIVVKDYSKEVEDSNEIVCPFYNFIILEQQSDKTMDDYFPTKYEYEIIGFNSFKSVSKYIAARFNNFRLMSGYYSSGLNYFIWVKDAYQYKEVQYKINFQEEEFGVENVEIPCLVECLENNSLCLYDVPLKYYSYRVALADGIDSATQYVFETISEYIMAYLEKGESCDIKGQFRYDGKTYTYKIEGEKGNCSFSIVE